METPGAERRKHPRYQALFPVSVILPGKELVFAEALNVSSRAVFFMLGSQIELAPGSEAEVAMHLMVGADPGIVAEKIYGGRVVRKASLNAHQGVAVFFDEEIDLRFLERVQQILAERESQTHPVLRGGCFIVEVTGCIEPKHLSAFEDKLSQLAFSVNSDVILDMAQVLSICSEVFNAIVRAQKLLHSVGRSLQVVCPRCYLQGAFHSEELARLLGTVQRVYPCINTAIAAEKERETN